MRLARTRASRIEGRLKKVAERVDASRQLITTLEPLIDKADEELALIESLRKKGKSESTAAKEASAAMKAKELADEAKSSGGTVAGVSTRVPPSIPGEIESQRALLQQARSEYSKRNARLRRIERRFIELRDSVTWLKKQSSYASGIFDARLASWTDTAASASGSHRETTLRDSALPLESGAVAAVAADLGSARADVELVIHIGAPFDGASVLAAVRSALSVTKATAADPRRARYAARVTAANVARAAIRRAWTQPTARAALSHGSHLLLASLGYAISKDAHMRKDPRQTFEAAQVTPAAKHPTKCKYSVRRTLVGLFRRAPRIRCRLAWMSFA